jgi:predicted ATPase
MLNGTGPLLLEEPELSLHQGIIRYLPQLFARVQRIRGRQLLLSTHSQDLLQDDGIGLDEVLLLKFAGNKEGTTLESAKQKREISSLLKGGCNLADVVLSQTRPERAEQMTFLFPEGA